MSPPERTITPMGIEYWRVVQIHTPGYPPYVLAHGMPAEMLTHEAQWIRGVDPDTGEPTASFIGPEFQGSEITVELEAQDRPEAGSLGVVARFDRFVPSGPPLETPHAACPYQPGTFESLTVGAFATRSGPVTLVPSGWPIQAKITLTLVHVDTEPEKLDPWVVTE